MYEPNKYNIYKANNISTIGPCRDGGNCNKYTTIKLHACTKILIIITYFLNFT